MKMSLEDLKSMYKPVMIVPGNPDTLTGATRKNHIHVVNPSAKPSKGLSSHAQARKDTLYGILKSNYSMLGGEITKHG